MKKRIYCVFIVLLMSSGIRYAMEPSDQSKEYLRQVRDRNDQRVEECVKLKQPVPAWVLECASPEMKKKALEHNKKLNGGAPEVDER